MTHNPAYFEKNERFAIPEVVRIMGQLLGALEVAHKNGIVHRDIKPGNIYIVDGGNVKVTDFGIARVESSELTQVGMVLGTPPYMSPEQFMGHPLDGRSDLFSAITLPACCANAAGAMASAAATTRASLMVSPGF